jgi:hypothetical protein
VMFLFSVLESTMSRDDFQKAFQLLVLDGFWYTGLATGLCVLENGENRVIITPNGWNAIFNGSRFSGETFLELSEVFCLAMA